MLSQGWFGFREFVELAVGVPGGLALELGGEVVEIGGVGEESVTLSSPNGMTIFADLDGDGVVDHVTMHNFTGGYEVWSHEAVENGWGLPTEESLKPVSRWGLESEVSPNWGREVDMESSREGRWMCIDRG